MKIIFLVLISIVFLIGLMGGSSLSGNYDVQIAESGLVSNTLIIVGDIAFVMEKGGSERISIPFNRTCMPKMSLVLRLPENETVHRFCLLAAPDTVRLGNVSLA